MENLMKKFFGDQNSFTPNIPNQFDFVPEKRKESKPLPLISSFRNINAAKRIPDLDKMEFPLFQADDFFKKPFANNFPSPIRGPTSDMKLQIMEAKLKNLEDKQIEEKRDLLEIFKKNFFDNQKSRSVKIKKRKAEKIKDKSAKEDKMYDLLEEFKYDVSKELQSIKRKNDKIPINDALEEIQELNKKIKRKNLEEGIDDPLTRLNQEISDISKGISKKINDGGLKNSQQLDKLGEEFKYFKDDIISKIEKLENKQKQELNGMNQFLKIGEFKKQEMSKLEPIYKNEIKKMPNFPLINYRKKKSDLDESIGEFLKNKKEKNEKSQRELESLNPELFNDMINFRKKSIHNLKDKILNQIKSQHHANNEKIEAILNKYRDTTYIMKPLNKFRSIVYFFISGLRIDKEVKNARSSIRVASLKAFSNSYVNYDEQLKQFIFYTIRTPYLNIMNFPNMNFDLKGISVFSSENEIQDKYIKLETRLKGFVEFLINSLPQMSENILKYLSIISSNYSYIPKEFYSSFENARLHRENDILVDVDEETQKMIFSCYIIMKILIHNILIEHQFSIGSSKNDNIKSNFTVISSIIYHTTLKILKDLKLPEQRLNTNTENSIVKVRVPINMSSVQKEGKYDLKYQTAYNAFLKKLNSDDDNTEDEQVLMKSIIKKLIVYSPDKNPSSFEFIENKLYSEEDLKIYYKHSKSNNFDLSPLIIKWLSLLWELVSSVSH